MKTDKELAQFYRIQAKRTREKADQASTTGKANVANALYEAAKEFDRTAEIIERTFLK